MSGLFPSEGPSPVAFARVALEQGIDVSPEGLTYGVPASLRDLRVGERVVVPLGRGDKPATGFVTAISGHCELDEVKLVRGRDPGSVSLTPDLIELARWLASYYCCPLGMVFATMLPAAVKRGTGSVTLKEVRAAPPPPAEGDAAAPAGPKLTKLQQSVLDAARAQTERGKPWTEVKRLADLGSARTVRPVQQLIAKGMLETREQTAVRADPFIDPPGTPASPVTMSAAQQTAVDRLSRSLDAGFGIFLLHGVTGSGKTEVYLQLIERLVRMPGERGAIVLVPEIALTPQTTARFLQRFERVAVLHSGLRASQRHEQWRRIRTGDARIVVGARSAIFAPLSSIGAIIVDEEHEQSYKQDQLPRYHARDVAIRRAQILGVPVVLGSATPSLESYYNATEPIVAPKAGTPAARGRSAPRYELIELPDRVTGLTLPRVQVIDMIAERRRRRGIHLLSGRLEDLLRHVLRHRGQAMLLLNRRGYANYVACPDHHCGWQKICTYCDAAAVYHRDQALPTGGVMRCHHCDAEQMLERLCPTCGRKVTLFGLGTQRVEEELSRKLPQMRYQRMDSDTMRTGRDYLQTLDRFGAGEIDVLIGTQMIAKGLDYPNVRLVGVISADTALHLPDFRAAERTFSLIAQVAGRAGRGDEPGIVVVQTYSPEDVTIDLASRHDYAGFAQRELAIRREVGLPPVTRMARIVVRHLDLDKARQTAQALADTLALHNRHLDERVELGGPSPCPIARIAEHHRLQIEMTAPDAATLQRLLTSVRNEKLLRADQHTAIDIDPLAMM
ncbi:MAG: primosomal protein N' [Phycisphaeraceae bacterium]|nr:primosomal protein N' [Phycisphaeraceae bacterium]